MRLGRIGIAVGALAALTTLVATGAAVRSTGGNSIPAPLTPLSLATSTTKPGRPASPTNRDSSTTAAQRRHGVDMGYLRAQWLDAEAKIRAAGATASQQEQQAIPAKDGPAIATALNQEVSAIGAQDQRISALSWPASMKPDIDSFGSTSAAALDQLRVAAANPFGYDANQVNAAIAAFNGAANAVRRDLGLPPD